MSTQEFKVKGMTCEHCSLSVNEEVKEIHGVVDVRSDFTTGHVQVISLHPLERVEVERAIKEAGYELL